jgi:hypothetical protein
VKIQSKQIVSARAASGRVASSQFERPMKAPDPVANRLVRALLPYRGGRKFLHQPFAMHPAQGMIGDAELTGVVADNDRIPHQSLCRRRASQRALAEDAHQLAVEHVDGKAGQMHETGMVACEGPARMSASSPDRRMKAIAASLPT